ncbi:MAG: NAD(+) diphosphatase [Granulosicoccus sp.]|nr:NAD(+) diphosphatase [Granulosicoccus sp.]
MFYTQSTLDRADHLRKDDTRMQALRQHHDTRLVPLWQGQSLVNSAREDILPQALLLPADTALPPGLCVFLGLLDTVPLFAVDVSSLDEAARDELAGHALTRTGLSVAGCFTELRVAGPLLPDEDGSLLAYARGMIYWNNNTRHCLRCGTLMRSTNAGHTRQCTRDSCGYIVFPRTDPAVIMLVSHTPEAGEPVCLLGRHPSWPEGVFSTLAGFVEPGESLENAVRREVLEEAAIRTGEVRYVASQPWPFPRSIMLGFEARALSTEICCDPLELADAQWFTRGQLRRFGSWGDEGGGYKMPRKDSIARFLIDRWLSEDADLISPASV